MTTSTGSCLCEAISYQVDGELRDVLHCHCVNCRKITGNFVASTGSATDDLTIADPEENLRWYDLGYARYGFCSTCGSTLFWQGADHPEHTSIQAGSVDNGGGLSLAGVWFTSEVQPYNSIDESVPQFDRNGE